jgi:phosphomannomutase
MKAILARARAWLDNDPDPDTRRELTALLEHPEENRVELTDRFSGSLEFGTAGLRGVIGAGENRMNRAVVRRTTYGLGQELLAIAASVPGWSNASGEEPVVVIGYDGRRQSDVFARDAALVLTRMGISVRLFPACGPTPLTAFTVTRLGAAAGIMVTASHNPPEYNGYKVYWKSGAQIVPPIDSNIKQRIDSAPAAKEIALDDLEKALADKRLQMLDRSAWDAYKEGAKKLGRPGGERNFRIVYTALHGVGNELAMAVLAESGFGQVTSVPEQKNPDGAFPTVAFPNPEEKGAMDLSFALARKEGAELVLANDPDADRLAVAVPQKDSPTGYLQLTGNDVGVLLGHHVLTRDPEEAKHPRVALASIVSSPMLGVIARALDVGYEETLTGFKWIEHRAMQLEAERGTKLAFGYEEALGYTVGTLVRDKDGIGAALVFAELVGELRAAGKTVQDRQEELFRRFGLFVSTQVNVTKKGPDGGKEIAAIMSKLRAAPPAELGGLAVLAHADFETGLRTKKDGTKESLGLPPSNVLSYDLEGGSRVIARPSGTEPKVKFYFDVRQPVTEGQPLDEARARANEKLDRVKDAFTKLI